MNTFRWILFVSLAVMALCLAPALAAAGEAETSEQTAEKWAAALAAAMSPVDSFNQHPRRIDLIKRHEQTLLESMREDKGLFQNSVTPSKQQ